MRKSMQIAILGYAILVGILIVVPFAFVLLVLGFGALVFVSALIGWD